MNDELNAYIVIYVTNFSGSREICLLIYQHRVHYRCRAISYVHKESHVRLSDLRRIFSRCVPFVAQQRNRYCLWISCKSSSNIFAFVKTVFDYQKWRSFYARTETSFSGTHCWTGSRGQYYSYKGHRCIIHQENIIAKLLKMVTTTYIGFVHQPWIIVILNSFWWISALTMTRCSCYLVGKPCYMTEQVLQSSPRNQSFCWSEDDLPSV